MTSRQTFEPVHPVGVPRRFTLEETARILRVSKSRVQRMVADGDLRACSADPLLVAAGDLHDALFELSAERTTRAARLGEGEVS